MYECNINQPDQGRSLNLTYSYLQLSDSREIFDREITEAHKKLTGDAPLRPPFKEDSCVSAFDKVWLTG